jgi:predicted alpha-1,2-mannosidase
MRPRLDNGRFAEPYDPIDLGHSTQWRDFTESNGWQATFLNQHDIYGLISLFGGDDRFAAQIDALFNAPSTLPANAPPDISGLVGQYAHGNEPSHHVAYLYAYAGQPWKTQAMARRLCNEMYKADPDGVIGNDDCGQMSAWFVLSSLGLYPVDPTSGAYVFGSPLFDRVEVRLGKSGARLMVEAPGNAPDAPYIQSVEWRGQPWSKGWISHAELQRAVVWCSRWARRRTRALPARQPTVHHPSVAAPRDHHAAGIVVTGAALALGLCATPVAAQDPGGPVWSAMRRAAWPRAS